VLWLGLKSSIALERYFFMVLAAGFVVLAILVAYPPVLNAIQGIFWFSAKVLGFLYAFIWYRATFPRYRYDQLMNVGWRWMIPLALANLIVTAVGFDIFGCPTTGGGIAGAVAWLSPAGDAPKDGTWMDWKIFSGGYF
jgi:hypothetical protein